MIPLIKSGKQAIADAINLIAPLGLNADHIAYGNPEVLDPVGENGENTRVRLLMRQSAPARGATTVLYRRLPFSTYFTEPDGINPLVIPTPLTANFATDLVPSLRQFCGMDIAVSDLVDTNINRQDMTVLLQAAENSLGWTGSITAKLTSGDIVISDAFKVRDLTGFYAYPNLNTVVGQAAVYSYRHDYSLYSSILTGITADNLEAQGPVLAQVMKTVTKDGWMVYRNPSDYNLKSAVFRYNGLNNNQQYLGNTNYSRVLVIELSFYCLKLGGLLYIHYNA